MLLNTTATSTSAGMREPSTTTCDGLEIVPPKKPEPRWIRILLLLTDAHADPATTPSVLFDTVMSKLFTLATEISANRAGIWTVSFASTSRGETVMNRTVKVVGDPMVTDPRFALDASRSRMAGKGRDLSMSTPSLLNVETL